MANGIAGNLGLAAGDLNNRQILTDDYRQAKHKVKGCFRKQSDRSNSFRRNQRALEFDFNKNRPNLTSIMT